MRVRLAALILCAAALAAPAKADAPLMVSGGLIEGRDSANGSARLYYGIPYAAPPLAELRWRAPMPVLPWNGIRNVTQAAPACLQNDYQWNRAQYLVGSEDCLTLDIRAPKAGTKPLPVMVWIHGGSNRAGGNGETIESAITDKGVVLVSVQYRLGIFGFLSHRDLAAEQSGSSGNYGLMDQVAALKWVQDNISRFGGDPGNVTIFGESAGSQDVSLLLATPSARGLFHKAIMQSGTPGFGMAARPLSEAMVIGDQLDRFADDSAGIKKLRKASAHALLAADKTLVDAKLWTQEFMWLRPTIDGHVLPADPEKLLNDAPPRPVIIGSNKFEFGPVKGSINVDAYARHWFGVNANAAIRLYQAEEETGDPRLGHLEGRMETDVVFRCPANNLAEKLSRLGWPVWRYEFDVGPDDGTPEGGLTRHAYEVSFIFDRKPIWTPASPVYMQDYWTAFVSQSADATPTLRGWDRYISATKSYVLFDRKGITPMKNLRPQHCAFVRAI
jgi:para-nitrobenzyl esterase